MARVKQSTIEKAQAAIDDFMSSPACPSQEDVSTSNTTLFNLVTIIKTRIGEEIPEKTLCGLIAESFGLAPDVTGEALWKRYSRKQVRGQSRQSDAGEGGEGHQMDSENRDGFGKNRDTSPRFIIDPGISQTELAASLAEFFESKDYSSASLLKTCLMAMEHIAAGMEVSEIHKAVDKWYRHVD